MLNICGMIVAEQAGNGVIIVGPSVTDTLLAVTVTLKPSVTVIYTVGGTDP
jgi:hypothetical protein